jgi:arsenite methyltransferase
MSSSDKTAFDSQQNAREYYGQELSTTADLKTTACCTTESIPDYVQNVLPEIHAEVLLKYYGCGTAFPPDISGLRVLDLGCGSGRDSYVMSKLVGAEGYVYGLDMTPEQIDVASRHREHMAGVFGYGASNVEFVTDVIENMDRHFAADSLDLVTSNCVINLLADKEPVLAQVHSLLRQGGEFYFSDVYVDRRLPQELQEHPMLHGECLGGALYDGDFVRMARRVGFADPRLVSCRVVDLEPDVAALVGNAVFTSRTYRL